jgi:hypothetical protein
MTKFGFKEINQQNWLEPDDVMKAFSTTSPIGVSDAITGEEWLGRALMPTLEDTVPHPVQALFEVARSALAYGYFFYPLYTLATEQLFRVAEAAVFHKCRALGAPSSLKIFSARVNWLAENGFIDQTNGSTWTQLSDKKKWDLMRDGRNVGSHPKMQTLILPGAAMMFFQQVAQTINNLFALTNTGSSNS